MVLLPSSSRFPLRRLATAAVILLLALPVVGAGTIVSNTKVSSPQIGDALYVSHAAGVDWSAKLTATLDKVGATGSRVTEEPGLHNAGTPLTVAKSHVLLDLPGTKLTFPSQSASLLTITGHNVTLQGAVIDAANVTGTNCGVRVTGSNVTLRDLVIIGGPRGICLDGAYSPNVERVVVTGQSSSGILLTGTSLATLYANLVDTAPTGVVIEESATNTRLLYNRLSTATEVSDASTTTTRLDGTGLTLRDVALLRDAADRWKTPDGLIVGANLGIGVSSAPVRLAVSDGTSAVAQTGLIGLPNNAGVRARNAANNADVPVIATDTSNNVVLGGSGANNVLVPNGQFLASGNLGIGVSSAPVRLAVSDGTSPVAQTGLIGLPNNAGFRARNAANSADLPVIGTDASNNIVIGGSGINNVLVPNGQVIIGGDTNLFRSAADILGTADSFAVGGARLDVRGVQYTWPASQGAASTYLRNDGSGGLSWASSSSTTVLSGGTGQAFADASTKVYGFVRPGDTHVTYSSSPIDQVIAGANGGAAPMPAGARVKSVALTMEGVLGARTTVPPWLNCNGCTITFTLRELSVGATYGDAGSVANLCTFAWNDVYPKTCTTTMDVDVNGKRLFVQGTPNGGQNGASSPLTVAVFGTLT